MIVGCWIGAAMRLMRVVYLLFLSTRTTSVSVERYVVMAERGEDCVLEDVVLPKPPLRVVVLRFWTTSIQGDPAFSKINCAIFWFDWM